MPTRLAGTLLAPDEDDKDRAGAEPVFEEVDESASLEERLARWLGIAPPEPSDDEHGREPNRDTEAAHESAARKIVSVAGGGASKDAGERARGDADVPETEDEDEDGEGFVDEAPEGHTPVRRGRMLAGAALTVALLFGLLMFRGRPEQEMSAEQLSTYIGTGAATALSEDGVTALFPIAPTSFDSSAAVGEDRIPVRGFRNAGAGVEMTVAVLSGPAIGEAQPAVMERFASEFVRGLGAEPEAAQWADDPAGALDIKGSAKDRVVRVRIIPGKGRWVLAFTVGGTGERTRQAHARLIGGMTVS